MSDQFAPTPVKTKTNGDVVAKIVDAAGTNQLAVAADGSINANVNGTTTTNLTKIGGTNVSVSSGTADAGTLRVAPATDVIQRVSKDGNANSVSNAVFVELTDGTTAFGTAANPIAVVIDPTDPTATLVDSGQLTSSALASAASANLDGANISAGLTGKVLAITATASVRIKVELQTWNGTTATTKRTFFVFEGHSLDYKPERNSITFAGGTTANFRLKITNMDNVNASDVYGSITYETV